MMSRIRSVQERLICFRSIHAGRVLKPGLEKNSESDKGRLIFSKFMAKQKTAESRGKGVEKHSPGIVLPQDKGLVYFRPTEYILNQVGAAIVLMDSEDRLFFANHEFKRMFNVKSGFLKKKSPTPFRDIKPLEQIYSAFVRERTEQHIEELEIRTEDEKVIHLAGFIRPLYSHKRYMGAIMTLMDVTEFAKSRHKIEGLTLQMDMAIARKTSDLVQANEMLLQKLKRQAEHEQELLDVIGVYESLFMESSRGVCKFTPDGMIIEANMILAENLGYNNPESLMKAVNSQGARFFREQEQWVKVRDSLLSTGRLSPMEVQLESSSGKDIWTEISGLKVLTRRKQTVFEFIVQDISESKEREALLLEQATIDSLTGIPNRMVWKDRLDQVLARARRYADGFAVLYLDLDGFKAVNDSLGHEAGDRVLKAVVTRIQDKIRESDTLARIGGDEFCLLMLNPGRKEDIARVARDIIKTVAEPVSINGEKARVGISIGIFLHKDQDLEYQDVMNKADAAMYQAKMAGGNRFCFA